MLRIGQTLEATENIRTDHGLIKIGDMVGVAQLSVSGAFFRPFGHNDFVRASAFKQAEYRVDPGGCAPSVYLT